MGVATQTDEAGFRCSDVNIDGTALTMPMSVEYDTPLPDVYDFVLTWELSDNTTDQQTALQTLAGLRTTAGGAVIEMLNGRRRVNAPYRGSGLPDIGGTHTFTFWKYFRYTFTAIAGQQYIYLPTCDAFSMGYSGKTVQADFGINVSTPDTTYALGKKVYKNSVLTSDVVTADEVWISKATAAHPDSGANTALVKWGTPLTVGGTVTVEYIPLWNVAATRVPPKAFDIPGREDTSLYLIQVN